MGTLSSNKDYINFIWDLKQKIKNAQVKAMVTVNQQMLLLYREIGKSILQRQEESDWWDNVIGQVSKDLKMEFPGMTGFSKTSLKYMRTFASEYPEFEIGQPVVDQISWTHNVILMNRVKDIKERLRYAQKVLENWWSKRVLDHRIDSKLYERKWQALTNFSTTLLAVDSDFSTQMLKDPYVFDFLSLTQEAKEKIDYLRELYDGTVKVFDSDEYSEFFIKNLGDEYIGWWIVVVDYHQ